ncbi:TetR/AcrR family transcriptional regulator [Adlercreutzia sp. ZJ473]|uniref:TetR/AcrR family transcriptional regulator n=1 Tax=Adlercreutzia sp. ZJ473 TaxID=2722822 RepID=UPI0015520DFE|nr:TetR/AcrR family transcriptional regulator [Adlercreutzia sp. ZJ473]
MAKKNLEKRAATRKRIMDSCWDVYVEKGASGLTVKEIITRAKVHRSTFYEYFDSAQDAFDALEDELIALIQAEALLAMKNDANDPASLVRHVYVEHQERLSVLLGSQGDPSFSRRIADTIICSVVGSLDLGEPDDQVPYVLEFALVGALSAITLWYERGCDLSSDELGALVARMLRAVTAS